MSEGSKATTALPDSQPVAAGGDIPSSEPKCLLWSDQRKILWRNEVMTENGKDREAEEAEAKELARKSYLEILQRQYENLIVLAGAGSSVGQGQSSSKGKTMSELWKSASEIPGFDFNKFRDVSGYDSKECDLESLLSKANRSLEFVSDTTTIADGITLIEKLIREQCTLELKSLNSPHQILINRITKRKLKYARPKIFTLNYDTLFEQAAQRERCVLIDGFSFSFPREFDGRLFDYDVVIRENSRIKNEENFATKVIHLYKLHGSIGWNQTPTGITQTGKSDDAVIIYPKDSKYERIYERPFFEMMARFQSELRKPDVLLICTGFSLSDKHVFTVIKEALMQNHGFQVLVLNRTIRSDENWTWLREKASRDSRITLVAETFEDLAQNYPDIKSVSPDERLRDIYSSGENIAHTD